MKKIVILIVIICLSQFLHAQVAIQMEKEGGVYKVPCNVNGVKMKFIFDTGASTVCMSQTMAQFLLDGDYLSSSDIKGTGQSVVADGSIVNHAVIVLRDIEIAGLHLHNIQATVIEGQNAPLLLGQTAISELGRITIDGSKLIIHTADNELTDEQISQLGEQAEKHIEARRYSAAIECIERIDEAVGLSEYGLWELCFCYSQNQQYSQCVQACNRWIAEYENDDEYGDKKDIYGYLAGAYYFGFEDYNKALLWYQKQATFVKNDEEFYENYLRQAWCYEQLNNPKAVDYYYNYIIWKTKVLYPSLDESTVTKQILNGKIKNEKLGMVYYHMANSLYAVGKYTDGDGFMIGSAQLGYQLAQNYCIAHQFKQLYPGTPWNFR